MSQNPERVSVASLRHLSIRSWRDYISVARLVDALVLYIKLQSSQPRKSPLGMVQVKVKPLDIMSDVLPLTQKVILNPVLRGSGWQLLKCLDLNAKVSEFDQGSLCYL